MLVKSYQVKVLQKLPPLCLKPALHFTMIVFLSLNLSLAILRLLL